MTEEPKVPEVAPIVPEVKQPDLMDVDFNNKSYKNIPVELAKEIIAFRQTKKELDLKNKEAEKAKLLAEEKARILEAAKSQDVERIKDEASKEYKTKLQSLQAKILDKEIKSSFHEADDFLKEYSEDAVKLFKSEFSVEYDENENLKANGKDIKEAVKEFINRKEIFRKASTQKASTIPSQKPINVKSTISPEEMMKKGLAEMFKK